MNVRTLTATEHRLKEQMLTQPEASHLNHRDTGVVLKRGEVTFLCDDAGDVPWTRPHTFGLIFRDCRFLDGYTLRLNDTALVPLGCSNARGFESFHNLVNDEIEDADDGHRIPRNTVAVSRERLLHGGVLHEMVHVRNFGARPVSLRLAIRYRSQFDDLFVMRRFVEGPTGVVQPPRTGARSVRLGYHGRDGRTRRTTMVFSDEPARLTGEAATFTMTLASEAEYRLAVAVTAGERDPHHEDRTPAQPALSTDHRRKRLERSEQEWLALAPTVRSSNPLFDRVIHRALSDLGQLRSRLKGRHFFVAGIPWFDTLFGRDAALTAIQTLPYGCRTAGETLELLARYQATCADPFRDAEPGKILHELRRGELALLGILPQSPVYYGSVDATLLFLILVDEYVAWSGDAALARALRPNIDAALDWIERVRERHPHGFLTYANRYDRGLINQGWKDSGNAIVNADGTLAEPPIALSEVQGYLYRAWLSIARVYRLQGDERGAERLERRAADLRDRFAAEFWSDRLGCYLLARQRDDAPVEVVTSNAGQVLWTGIATPDHAARVVERLLQPDMFSGWGIRTLSAEAEAYNPLGYHLGTVWPHDNAIILAGFRRYGYDAAALHVFDALFDAACDFRNYRLPELYSGYTRRAHETQPVGYPVACSPQAWSAAAMLYSVWMLLGLQADASAGRLRLERPVLPDAVEWLHVEGVRVGRSVVDLEFERRADGRVEAALTARRGGLTVEPGRATRLPHGVR